MTHQEGRTAMSSRPARLMPRLPCVALVVALLGIVSSLAPAAAITVGTPTTTLSSPYAGATSVTYTFSGYTVGNGESLTGAAITFPAGTDVSGATLVSPAGTLSVSGQTVTLTFSPVVPRRQAVTISVGGITNPVAPGPYTVGNITFLIANPGGSSPRPPQQHPSGAYTILTHHLTMTVTTPDAGQSVLFGSVNPDVTSPAKTVGVTVDSSVAYTITRTVSGDASLMGLVVTGTAHGAGSAGVTGFSDSLTVTPPWTTDPDVTYGATVTYSVVQN